MIDFSILFNIYYVEYIDLSCPNLIFDTTNAFPFAEPEPLRYGLWDACIICRANYLGAGLHFFHGSSKGSGLSIGVKCGLRFFFCFFLWCRACFT
jgi:hypothetical protein